MSAVLLIAALGYGTFLVVLHVGHRRKARAQRRRERIATSAHVRQRTADGAEDWAKWQREMRWVR